MVHQWRCLALILCGLTVRALALDFDIEFDYSISENVRPQRMIAELSLNDGRTWRPLIYGAPTDHGTNILTISLTPTAALLSEQARIRLTEMPYRGINATNTQRGVLVSAKTFTLAGCFIGAPASNAFWRVSEPTTLRWWEAGGGGMMAVGISRDGAETFDGPVAYLPSLPAPSTNVFVFIPAAWGVTNLGSVWLCMQSVTDPKVQAVAGPITVTP